jgi:DNA-binding NarL/FixJ family response regulator
MNVLLVEDNERLRPAMKSGLSATGEAQVTGDCGSGEEALQLCWPSVPMWC